MGCDYYHEAIKGHDDASDEPGELRIKAKVYDDNGTVVDADEINVTVPVGGKVYLDRLPERPPIWAR